MKAITVEALSKTFSGGTVAVDRIRFSLNQGEIFGFLGPNGAGKTTTVKLLCGMLTPSGGKCQVLGMERYAALLRKCCPGECLSLEKSSQIHRCCGPLRFDLHF